LNHQRVFLIVGPSGSGKTTLVQKLKALGIPEIVSLTTREPRPGEVDGVAYFFVDRARFDALRDAGELIEWVEYNGNFYATTRAAALLALAHGNGRAVVVVDGHGARQYRDALPGVCEAVFLYPPRPDEIRRRLVARGDKPEVVEARLSLVGKEMIFAVEAEHTVPPGTEAETLARVLAIMG
jgi:guanylate kinase